VARYGGEEFVAVLPGTHTAEAVRAAERIVQAVDALQLPYGDGRTTTAHVTVSVGVTTTQARPELPMRQVLAKADEALYQAKHAGRHRVVSLPS
jgi:diguanylate cyclase (GGDEF)-like protein